MRLISLLLFLSLTAKAASPIGASYLQLKEVTQPSNPASGYQNEYVSSSDHFLHIANSGGTSTTIQNLLSFNLPLSVSGVTVSCAVASGSQAGCLSSTDWTTFNNKQSTITTGNLTDAGTDGITVTGGTGAVIGSGASIAQAGASASQNGYLASTDWNTFNGKQSSLTFSDSVENTAGTVTLVGDSASPGASKYYGTNSGSTLGYYSVPSGGPSTPGTTTTGDIVTWNSSTGAAIQDPGIVNIASGELTESYSGSLGSSSALHSISMASATGGWKHGLQINGTVASAESSSSPDGIKVNPNYTVSNGTNYGPSGLSVVPTFSQTLTSTGTRLQAVDAEALATISSGAFGGYNNSFLGDIGVAALASNGSSTGYATAVNGTAIGNQDVGVSGIGENGSGSSLKNVGVYGGAQYSSSQATGVYAALNTSSNTIETAPIPNASAALVANNGNASAPVALFQVNGTTDVEVDANGILDINNSATIKQISTPSDPASGYDSLYFKSGDGLYFLTSGGTETEVATLSSGAVPVAQGGTGQTSLTSGDVLLGNGTSGITQTALPSISNAISSNGTGPWRVESAYVTGGTSGTSCTGTCTVQTQTGSWVTGVVRNSTGNYTVSYTGAFSAAPNCTTATGNAVGTALSNSKLPGSSSVVVNTFTTSTVGVTDSDFQIICMGAK
jgi:hypothetical protein